LTAAPVEEYPYLRKGEIKSTKEKTTMPLPEHDRNKDGSFRQENGNSRAKNLVNDYPEFAKVPPNTKLGTLRDRSGETSINGVREYIRKNYK